MSGTTNNNKWQRVTTNNNEWQRVTISANFSFFQIREEFTTKHPKENSLNLEEALWRRPIVLKAETSPWEEILTVRSSCSQIFIKISVLKKNLAIFTGKHLCWSLFLRSCRSWSSQEKKTPTPVFSCEYCEAFKNSFFYRTHLVDASGTETFLVCDTYNFKIYEDSMTQT